MITEKNTIVKIKVVNLLGDVELDVVAKEKITSARLEVVENKTNRSFTFIIPLENNRVEFPFKIEKPLFWNTTNPNLYSYKLTLIFCNDKEEISGNFGFRELKSENGKFYLNNLPFFMRGYIRGTVCHDHSNNCKLSEADFYRKNILMAKKFGFNFIRFHSVVPNETFFNVADELGVLVHIELKKEDEEYNNLEEMITAKKILIDDDFIKNIINKFYNHPSLAVYCIGNEIKGGAFNDRVLEIGRLIKKEDPSRLFIDTCAWGASHRPNVDFDVQHMSYYFPFGKHAKMYEDTDNLLCCGSYDGSAVEAEFDNSKITRAIWFDKPLVAHEVCHYTALRDYKTLKEKFKKYGTKEPWWVDEEIKMIEAKGLTDSFDELYHASKYFQLECWKFAFEGIRASKLLSGYHFLQFADTDVYENSNGLVDCFDDENYIEAKDFIRFNADRVLLAEIKDRIYFEGDKVFAEFKISNFGEEVDDVADFIYTVTDSYGKIYTQGKLENIDISRKGLYDICKLYINLPEGKSSNRYIIKATLVKGDKLVAENWWNIWVYSKLKPISYKEFVNYEKNDCVITNDIEKAINFANRGKKVCLVYRQDWTRHVANKTMPKPKYAFKACWNRFKPVIWDRGTNYGGLNNFEVLNKHGFFTERFYDTNLSVLTEDCDKIDLTDFPVKVDSIISGTDKSTRDRFDAYTVCFNLPELMYDRTLRDFSYLFSVKVGKGNLLVCGLNMLALDKNEPSTLNMAHFIINYINSNDFSPEFEISFEAIKAYLIKNAEKPVKERMMTQFWTLDAEPVESAQYWKEAKEYLMEDLTEKKDFDII